MTKVAVGCRQFAQLEARNRGRTQMIAGQSITPIWTRYRPTRHDELVGGSLYWIVNHVIGARQRIVGFEQQRDDKGVQRCRILLSAKMIPVVPRRKRAHQGWRYLKGADAPHDLAGAEGELAELPAEMARELATLGLI